MTENPSFIAGDWGTTNLRLYLCKYQPNGDSVILDTRFGPGINQINSNFEDKFFSLVQDWFDHHGALPVLLSGMVGSTIGWKDAPYLSCPVGADQIAAGRIAFSARGVEFSILAGLRTTNPLNAPDVMRGEELQMLGWMRSQNSHPERQLFALPGTHNKWTLVERNHIVSFLTAFSGELFSLLNDHSILITDAGPMSVNIDAFMQGVNAAESLGDADLIHALFATRSKQVLGEMAGADAPSYLSGLITTADVMGATHLFDVNDSVTIIGEPSLTQHYVRVLDHIGIASETCDPATIAIAGFATIYQTLYQ